MGRVFLRRAHGCVLFLGSCAVSLALLGCADEGGGGDGVGWMPATGLGAQPGTGTGGVAGAGGIAGAGGTAGAGGIAGAGGFVAKGGVPGTGGIPGTGGAVGAGGSEPGTGGSAPPPLGDVRPSAGCGKASSPGGGDFSLNVDGTERTYIVAVPSGYDQDNPYRLIFTWHYLNGSASGIAGGGYYGMETRSAGTAILVSPEGINAGWSNTGGRDVAFARAMLDFFKENYCIDEARIFSTGFSYGGIMSNTVGCALGDEFRAIAPMSGSGPRGSGCAGQVAAWISHGDADTVVSFSGGQGSRDHWLNTNHCGSQTTDVGSCVSYGGCDDGYPVHWCQYGGGHTRPSFAPDAIWAFFEQF